MTKRRTKLNRLIRLISLALAMFIVISVLEIPGLLGTSIKAAESDVSAAEERRADTGTMDNYKNALNLRYNSQNAGRVWSDKTVLNSDSITLDSETDGVNGGTVKNDGDFLHVFSTLGSSRNFDGLIPSNLVIVIDNSGSMYANDKVYWKWGNTRIAKTVDAVNRAIDRLMEHDVMAQVAVVSFNNTGRTIIPMGHYSFTPDVNGEERYTKYLDAGWVLGSEPDGNSEPNHTDHSRVTGGGTVSGSGDEEDDDEADDSGTIDEDSGGGYIYVNNAAIGAKSNKKYTLYRSKSTNIQSGIYQGMKELLDAPKDATIPGANIVLERVPSLVVLTDGQATDINKGQWTNPDITDEGLIADLTFTNGFSKKKWLSFYDDCINPNTGKLVYGWHRFLTTNNLQAGYTYKMMGPSEQGSKVADHYTLDKSKADNRLPGLIEDFKQTQEYMLLSTLMTAGYFKAAINREYSEACNVYTISVDMSDPADKNYNGNVANGSVDVDSNPPMMNPKKYFSIDWLKQVGVLKANNNVNTNIYKEKTTGSQTVYSIRDAVTDFQNWKNNGAEINLNYRTITNTVKFTDDSKGRGSYIQNYTRPYGSSYWITGTPLPQTIKHLKNDSDNPYNLTDKDIDVNYADQAYYAHSSENAADSIENIFNTIMNQVTSRIFVPISGDNDAGISNALTYMDPIGQYMEVKNISDVTLFGTRYGITKTAVYDPDFIKRTSGFSNGWYDKNGNRLSNQASGSWGEHTYYVDFNTASQDISALRSDSATESGKNSVYTIYGISSIKAGVDPFTGSTVSGVIPIKAGSDKKEEHGDMYKLANPCYEDDSGIQYDLSSINIWVKDAGENTVGGGIESDTGYSQALYVDIPAEALPLQVVTVTYKEDLNETDYSKRIKVHDYTTNIGNYTQSTPFRVFYSVGIVDDVLTKDKNQIDREKISPEYIQNNSDKNGNIFIYSNWFKINSYSYNNAGQTYTRGDPILTFSPDHDNQYYTAQNVIPLYTYSGSDPEHKGFDVTLQDDSYKAGGITLGEVTGFINEDQWYYIVNPYFSSDKTIAYRAVARHGTEFGKEIGGENIKHGEYLCWYDTNNDVIKDYIDSAGNPINPGSGSGTHWVVALREGSLRTGNLSQSVGTKGDKAIPNTAGTFYLPTISSSTSGVTAEDVVVNVYHGNNGRISVPSTQLMITKYVNSDAKKVLQQWSEDMEFEFEIKLGDKKSEFIGTVIKRAASGVWIPQVDSVTINTTQNGLVQNGGEPTAHTAKLITGSNGKKYYLYVPEEKRTVDDPSSTIDAAIQIFTVDAYLIPENDVVYGWTFDKTKYNETQTIEIYRSDPNGSGDNALFEDIWTLHTVETKPLNFDKYSHADFTLKDEYGVLLKGLNYNTEYTTWEYLDKADGFNFVKVTDESGDEFKRDASEFPLVEENYGSGVVGYTVSGKTAVNKTSEVHYENTYASQLAITKLVDTAKGIKNKPKDMDKIEFAFQIELDGVEGDFDGYVLEYNGTDWERKTGTITTAVTTTNGLLLSADSSTSYEIVTVAGQQYYLYVPFDKRKVEPDANGNYYVTAFLIPKNEVETEGITEWEYKEKGYSTISHKLILITTDSQGKTTGNARTALVFITKKLTFGDDNIAKFTLKDGEGLEIMGIDSGTDFTVSERLSDELQKRNFGFTSITDENGKKYTVDNENPDLIVNGEKYQDGIAYEFEGTTALIPSDADPWVNYCNTYYGDFGFEVNKVTIIDGKEVAVNGVEFMLEYKGASDNKWYPVYYVEKEDANGDKVAQPTYGKTIEELEKEGISYIVSTSKGKNRKGDEVNGLLKFDNLFEGDFRLTEVSTKNASVSGLGKLASAIEFRLPYAVDVTEIEEYEKQQLVQLSDDYSLSEDNQTRYYNHISFKINNTAAQFDLPFTGTNELIVRIAFGVISVLAGTGICLCVFRKKRIR